MNIQKKKKKKKEKKQSDPLKLKMWLSSNKVSMNLRVPQKGFCPLEDGLLDFYFSLNYVL